MVKLSNHEIRFINKRPAETPPVQQPEPTPNTLDGLIATDLVTDVADISLSVFVDGEKSAQIILAKVTNWEISNRTLRIFSDDTVLLLLNFINSAEAQQALTRFETAMNGGTV